MSTQHVQTLSEIRAALDAAGLRPKRRFGQNFLIDGNLMRRLADEAELDPADVVLEVGGGTGGLTDLLCGKVAALICVELDRNLHALLLDRFRNAQGIEILQGDILESKHTLMPEVASRLSAAEPVNPGSLKLVANLPYQISAPLVMNLLVDFPQVKRLCFTVQSEVGQRIVASPGGKEFGPLGILSQTLACPRIIAAAPPQAFWPRPAVDSVLVRLDTVNSPFVDYAEARRFAVLVRKTFEHRRKTLRRAMGYVVDGPALARICESVEPSRRPETLSTDEWLEVFRLADEPS